MAEAAGDQGLQAERTALAWSRTALGVFVNALLLLRTGVVDGRWELAILGLLLLGGAGLTQMLAASRRRSLLQQQPVAAAPASLLLTLTLLAGTCSAGAVYAIARGH